MIARWWSTIDRLQKLRSFKIAATVVVVALMAAGIGAYAVASARASRSALSQIEQARRQEKAAQDEADKADIAEKADIAARSAAKEPGTQGTDSAAQGTDTKPSTPKPIEAFEASAKVYEGMIRAQHSVASVAIGIVAIGAILLGVVWLGLGLTGLLLLGCTALMLLVLRVAHASKVWAPMVVGVVFLLGSFSVLVRLAALALSAPFAVPTIAKNTLAEAMRMRVGLLFIAMLVFGLAGLPMALDGAQPLRYRVQSFLQYATTGSYWLIAILTVLFAVTTVAIDQRDKLVWQTMTKPVAPWQYILGKWLGVAVLSATLLGVSCAGVFAFTEYLRRQPAVGEVQAFVPSNGEEVISEDREILENQILTSKSVVTADPPDLDAAELEKNIQERIDLESRAFITDAMPPADQASVRAQVATKVRDSLEKNIEASYRTIEPTGTQYFRFSGLQDAKRFNRAVVLRYKINSGGNMPDQLYRLTFVFPSMQAAQAFEVPLSQVLTLRLMPTVINDNGEIVMQVVNGDVFRGEANPMSITFPPDGLRISFSTGSYQANFFRVVSVLWIKVLFLAMLGITAATFLSFPVAALVSFAVFIIAEGTGFLIASLEVYRTDDNERNTLYFNLFIEKFSRVVAMVFEKYASLRPTARLVEGETLSWGTFAAGSGVILAWTLVLYAVAVLVFRKRELAIYSGH